jgi:hypothetical protein
MSVGWVEGASVLRVGSGGDYQLICTSERYVDTINQNKGRLGGLNLLV